MKQTLENEETKGHGSSDGFYERIERKWRSLSSVQQLYVFFASALLVFMAFQTNSQKEEFVASSDSNLNLEEIQASTNLRLFENDEILFSKKLLSANEVVSARKFSSIVDPMIKGKIAGKRLVHCPNKDGGGKNKQCSKAYAEYTFSVEETKKYYLYVETIAPNIFDNSLWIGVPKGASNSRFDSCPKITAGSLIPHKHVKSSKWFCCPKYLTKNEVKGKDDFYYSCCYDKLGPNGDESGCILDLEVGSYPIWNELPRQIVASAKEVSVRLYAREDGTAVTRLFLSENPRLTKEELNLDTTVI